MTTNEDKQALRDDLEQTFKTALAQAWHAAMEEEPTVNAGDPYDTLPDGDDDQPTVNTARQSSNGRKMPTGTDSNRYDTLPE